MATKCALIDNVVIRQTAKSAVRYVIGPNGRRLTLADLPSPSTKRWVIRRKAEVVAAVTGGLLSLEEACSRYTLDYDEFLSWQAPPRSLRTGLGNSELMSSDRHHEQLEPNFGASRPQEFAGCFVDFLLGRSTRHPR
jgi:hypothetical protein